MRISIPNVFWLFILFLLPEISHAQTMAVTEYGDTIYVYDNGTWSFEALEEMPAPLNDLGYLSQELALDTISTKFKVPAKAKKQVKDVRDMFVIKYDDNTWKRVPPATLNDEADFAFKAKDADIWCIVIAEETPIQKDKLLLIAKNTMKERTGADPTLLKAEVRTVNGTEIIRGVMNAAFSGISFIFDTYYFSNELGSVQFTTWTSENLWAKHEDKIVELLNGFVVK